MEEIPFMIKDDSVLVKYNGIWNKIKKSLNIKFHSEHVYDKEYIKTETKAFNGVVDTVFSDDIIPKDSKRMCALHLYSLYKYWFCHENRQKNVLEFI